MACLSCAMVRAQVLLLTALTVLATEEEDVLLSAPLMPTMAPMPSLPTLSTLPLWNCALDFQSSWLEVQRSWCCDHEQVGCTSSTTTEGPTSTTGVSTTTAAATTTEKPTTSSKDTTTGQSTINEHHAEDGSKDETLTAPRSPDVKVDVEQDQLQQPRNAAATVGATTGKKTQGAATTASTTVSTTSTARVTTTQTSTTTLPATTTSPPLTETTTSTNSCNEPCVVNGVSAACRDQIQQASLSDYLGSPDSCQIAQEVTSEQCPVCANCPPHEAGCGVLELPTTIPPTTSIPQGDACKAVCSLGGQPATCLARIMWSKEHVFVGKPEACTQAHAMVLGQCPICSYCTVEATKCEEPLATSDSDEIFRCTQGATVEWSKAKINWCCERHQIGCDVGLQDSKKIFFEKKVATSEATAALPETVRSISSKWSRELAAALIGLSVLGGVVVLFVRSSSTVRQRVVRQSPTFVDFADERTSFWE